MPIAGTSGCRWQLLFLWPRSACIRGGARDVPAGKPFLAASAFGSLLLLSIAFQTAAIVPAARIAWYQWQYAVQMLAVTAGTCISLEYAYPGTLADPAQPRTAGSSSTADHYCDHLCTAAYLARIVGWAERYSGGGLYPLGCGASGPILGLLLVNAAAFLWLFVRSPQHRWPVALMLCGQIMGRALILLDIASIPSFMGNDLTVIAVLAPWTMYAVALLGFHILEPLPAAQQTALAQMREGMIVLDTGGRVASLNPAASAILNIAASQRQGRSLGELLPRRSDLSGRSAADSARREPTEISLAAGRRTLVRRRMLANSATFVAYSSATCSCCAMLRSKSGQRAQILEQERALATLRERERLARELHDGVTQLLAARAFAGEDGETAPTAGQRSAAETLPGGTGRHDACRPKPTSASTCWG